MVVGEPQESPEDSHLTSPPDTDLAGMNLDEALLTAGLTNSCSRKRRAAAEIDKVTALLKKPRKNSKAG